MKNGWLLTIFAVHALAYFFLETRSNGAELAYDITTGYECFMFACFAASNPKERKRSYFLFSLVLFTAVCALANCFKLNYAYLPNGDLNIYYGAVWKTLIGVSLLCYLFDNIYDVGKIFNKIKTFIEKIIWSIYK